MLLSALSEDYLEARHGITTHLRRCRLGTMQILEPMFWKGFCLATKNPPCPVTAGKVSSLSHVVVITIRVDLGTPVFVAASRSERVVSCTLENNTTIHAQ